MAARSRRKYAPRLSPPERREQLLDVALGLIAEQGYEGITMEAVAREARIAKPVVYDLFGNRGRLLRALLEREEGRALEQLAGAIPVQPVDADPDALVVDGLVAFLRAVADNPDRWRLILLPVEGTPDQVRDHVERGRRAVLAQLESLVAWGLQRRGGPEGLDQELAARAILTLAEEAGRLVLTRPDRFPPERLGAFAAQLMSGLQRAGTPAT